MNLSDAKCVEYTLSLFEEYLNAKLRGSEDLPTYRIVWKLNGKLVTGDLLKWDSSHRVPVSTQIIQDLDVQENPLSFTDDNHFFFPGNVRYAWFDKYEHDFYTPISIYENPAILLSECVKFVKNLHSKMIKDIQPRILNIHYLESNIKLDFLLLDPKVSLEPVSLIQVSKN